MNWREKIILIFKTSDLRNKILFVLAMFLVFRITAAIPIPGIDIEKLKSFFENNQFFGILNIFSGGTLSNVSIVMLGVGPYITASIIMQLLTMIFPSLKELYFKSGQRGYQKFNNYSRLLTVPLAGIQAYGLLILFQRQGILPFFNFFDFVSAISIAVAGSVFLMWIGELISEKGIGNGISLLIFGGIIARLPQLFGQSIITYEKSQFFSYLTFLIVSLLVIAGVVWISEAQRNIPVFYSKRVRGNKMYGGVSTYLPLRINQAGVIPIIFAISILLFPQMLGNFLALTKIDILIKFSSFLNNLFNNIWLYSFLYFVLVFLFTYFYTIIVFEPNAIAENLQRQGGFIPGIRPGPKTSEYIYKILNRVTLGGAIFLGLIAILPFVIKGITGFATLTIGGTSLLIVVAVAIETIKQIDAQLSMREYE